MIYLDSSALVKLVRAEDESNALLSYVGQRPRVRWFSSELSRTEVARAIRRLNADSRDEELRYAGRLWERLDLVPVSTRVLSAAAAIDHPVLRTLDAIHLATATGMRTGVSAFVTYDKRLAAAAENAALAVIVPS